jgi:hypothetical protein
MNLFSKVKLNKKEKQNDNIYRLLLPSLIAICVCTICLSTASWAWFTSTTSTSISSIKSSTYNLSYKVTKISDDNTETTFVNNTLISTDNDNDDYYDATITTGDARTYIITLSAAGTENASGYCVVKIGDTIYYTNKIAIGSTYSFNVPVNSQIMLISKWGELPTKLDQDEILLDITNNGSNAISLASLDDELSTNEEDVNTDAENKKQEESENNGETSEDEKTDDVESSELKQENQNIEETEKQNEELSGDSGETVDTTVPTDETVVTDKTLIGENDASQNSSLEIPESSDEDKGSTEEQSKLSDIEG